MPLEQADYVVCTGLADDETETPESYRAVLAKMRERNLFMICGNPDLVVERGDKLVYCAGAIADLYGELGGEVLYAGKPYRADLRGGAAPDRRKLRGATPPLSACWRSAIRSAPTSRAPCEWASTACSSPPASTPRSWAGATSRTWRRSTQMFADAGDSAEGRDAKLVW